MQVTRVLVKWLLCLSAVTLGINTWGAETQVVQSAAVTPAGTNAPPQDASARNFLESCSGCHTIGGGKLTGPDLNSAASWSKNDLKPAIKRMEQRVGPLSDAEVDRLADFIKDPQAPLRLKAAESQIALMFAAKLEPGSAQIGRDLFWGAQRLANGGMACVDCHKVKGLGGALGRDLTGVYARLGETALSSAIEKAGFLVMAPAYKGHPITKQEALHLTKFFASVNQPAAASGTQVIWPVATGIAGAFIVGLGLLSRKNNTTRRPRLERRRK